MNSASHERVTRLFAAACEMPPAARRAFLDRECAGDAALRAQVESLLAHDAIEDDAFSRAGLQIGAELIGVTVATGGRARTPGPETDPAQIGRYRILRRIGHGGMGAVYEAEQDNPRRRVAIKIIRPDAVSPSTLRRFAHEVELLGRLHHPGIAQVYEAGNAHTTQGDRPYYAMELIEGRTLAEQATGLPTRARLELFAKICDAVEFAHAHGVVHRDLKPANILVDELGQPKVLDFGVARLIGTGGVETTTLHTVAGQLIGTVPYMSPEQVSGDPDRVGVRSDVYALGVMLYELLASRLPLDLARKPLPEAAWIIREQEPSRLGSLDTSLRGDIETIAAKALEKDPSRRYSGAGALADDIRRFLRDEPIAARPPTATYQLRKFAKRNPGLVWGTAAALVALSLGLVVAGVAIVLLIRSQAEAKAETRHALDVTEAIKKALAASAIGADRDDITALDMLDHAEQGIAGELANAPDAEIEVRSTLGRTYATLGNGAAAIRNFRRAWDVARSAFGPEHPRTLACAADLAVAQADRLELAEAATTIGPGDSPQPYERQSGPAAAALESARRVLGPDDPATLRLMNSTAILLTITDAPAQAMPLFAELLGRLQRRPPNARPISLLGALCRFIKALDLSGFEEFATELRTHALRMGLGPGGEGPLEAAESAHFFLGESFLLQNRLEEAEQAFRRGIQVQEMHLGKWDGRTIRTRHQLSATLRQHEKFAERKELMGEMLEHERKGGKISAENRAYLEAAFAQDVYLADPNDQTAAQWEHAILDVVTLYGVKSHLSRSYWSEFALVRGLRVQDRWAGDGVRRHVRQILNNWFRGHDFAFSMPDIAWSSLRFEIAPWSGRSSTGDTSAAPTSGGAEELRSLPDPAPGVYRVLINVPRRSGEPIHCESWMLVVPWTIQLYHTATLCQAEERAATAFTTGVVPWPEEVTESSVLAYEGFWPQGFGPRLRQYDFGLLATAYADLPPGKYRFTLSADDRASLRIDGTDVIDGWSGLPISMRTCDFLIGAGTHELRVAYYQTTFRSLLFLTVEPRTDSESE